MEEILVIKIKHTETYGWEAAVRGMRNPLNSWNQSDSSFCSDIVKIGEKDLKLMKKLAAAGNDHGKFLRMINVTVDITAPIYWWKEFDTYKVGTVANSCSTMHKMMERHLTEADFSLENLWDINKIIVLQNIDLINKYIDCYKLEELEKEKKKEIWWQVIQMLPMSYNQKRTVQLNYAVLKNMYHSRKNHKLQEWHDFCAWVEKLPYAAELIAA